MQAGEYDAVGSTVYASQFGMAEASTPPAKTGFGKIYTKSDVDTDTSTPTVALTAGTLVITIQ